MHTLHVELIVYDQLISCSYSYGAVMGPITKCRSGYVALLGCLFRPIFIFGKIIGKFPLGEVSGKISAAKVSGKITASPGVYGVRCSARVVHKMKKNF